MIIFKSAPDYTIAHDNGICLDEWIGQPYEKFRNAMRKDPDELESYETCGRQITEYRWA